MNLFPLVAPALLLVVFVLAAWAGVVMFRGATNARLRAIGDALTRHGAHVLAVEPAPSLLGTAVLRFELGGQRGRITIRWWGRSVQKVSLQIDAAPRSGVWIRRPGFVAEGLARALGFERLVPLSGGSVSVATRVSDAAVRELLAPPEAQRLILELVDASTLQTLVGAGHQVAVGPEGLAVVLLTAALWPFDPGVVPPILERLEALDRVLPRPATPEVTPLLESHSVVVSSFTPTVTIFVLGLIMALPLHYPMAASAAQTMLVIGLAPLVGALLLLRRRYRGRPNATREAFFSAMGLTVLVPFLTFAVLAAVNSASDNSPVVIHQVRVLDHYKHNSHTVYVESWTPGMAREKVIVPKSIPVVSVGDTLEVQTRAGALGWAWVPAVVKR